GGCSPDRGSPCFAWTARTDSRRALPCCRHGSVGPRQAGESDSDAQFIAILTEAKRRRRDPFIGLHAGERCEPAVVPAVLLPTRSAARARGKRRGLRSAGGRRPPRRRLTGRRSRGVA